MAGLAAINHLAARRAERRHLPQGRFLEIDGVRLHYVDRGAGPTIVLLHGNGAMIEDFAISGLFDSLAQRYRVVAFDRPGFGHSTRPRRRHWTPATQAELIGAALHELGVEQAIVLGHSLGTLVALTLAFAEPELVEGLVLVSGYYFPVPRWDLLLPAPYALTGIGDVLRYTVGPLFARLLGPLVVKQAFAPSAVTPAFAARFPGSLSVRPSQLRAFAVDALLMGPTAALLAPRYGELAVPVAVLTGPEDMVVDWTRHARPLARVLCRARLQVTAIGGHMQQHLAPEAIEDAVGWVLAEACPADRVAAGHAEFGPESKLFAGATGC
ncbi:MAG: alpha/beta hydrolase [Alphaproteobacteria bacterium]|nr:alpha/beta hydrolase [Alphaproteobacteria bacterium]